MCQFCPKSNEKMEPNDAKLLGLSAEERVGSTLHSVNPDRGNGSSSVLEVSVHNPPLTSCESFASTLSEDSVYVPFDEGHSKEDDGFDSVQADGNTNGECGVCLDEVVDESDEPAPTFYEQDEFWDPPEAENIKDDQENSMTILDDEDDDEYADADDSEWAMPRSKEKQIAREEVKNGKFKDLVSQLLKKANIDICDAKEENWVNIVTHLAWQAAKFVKPGATEGKSMNPSGYVKIKCVAAGSPGESRLVKGLVFKKHAAHKHMTTNYKNPKLLLIQGMLGPSGSSGLSSFSSMISEDKDNWDDLIQNLQACQPNVILVEKSASRAVMEKILQMGITLVLDMKLNRLERVARCTGSPILSCDNALNPKLRHCDSLYFEKFVEEHAIVGEGGKKPSKTLMFLEGCPTRLGCTILLKGSHAEELKKIKCVVQCAVVMAYHFLLETSFLVDQKAMFSTITYGKAADISSTKLPSKSVACGISGIVHSEEPDIVNSLADEIPISDGGIQESYVPESTAQVTPISHGLQQEDSNHVASCPAKDAEITSLTVFPDNVSDSMQLEADNSSRVCCDPYMTTLSAASRSFSRVMEKVSIVSPDTYDNMSTYIDLKGRDPEIQSEVSVLVSPSEESADSCEMGAENKDKEEKSSSDDSQAMSTSAADGEEKGPADDVEESIGTKDEICSVLDSESILILKSSRNALKGTICEQSHFSQIKFYKNFDVPLGKFLRDNLFNQALKCEACGQLPEAHYYYYAHHSKQLTIRVKRLEKRLPREPEGKLWMWSRCSKCEPDKEKATKRVLISTGARGLSFGKFLELSFSSHSSFNRLANCGHCFQKDFLYFFGFGSTVAMFQYSRVAIYNVSVPAHKLEFNSSIEKGWLQPEIRNVYTTGLVLFNELEKYLKKIESKFSDWKLVLNSHTKGFPDILDMLRLERFEFEENFKSKNDSNDSVYKLLSLNRLRWEILLEACVWDRRLQSLLSSYSTVLQSTVSSMDEIAAREMDLKEQGSSGEEAEGLKTAEETLERMHSAVRRSGKEDEVTQKIVDKEKQELVDSVNDRSNEAKAATTMVKERRTGSYNAGAEEFVQSSEDACHSVMIERKEVTLHSGDQSSENVNDGEVKIEMVAETESLSAKESLNKGIIVGHGEQVLRKLTTGKDTTPGLPSCDSVPSVSLALKPNGIINLPSHLHSEDETTQQDNISDSEHLSEDRSISIQVGEETSSCSADGEVPERLGTPVVEVDSLWWNPFAQTREECMEDLLEGRPSRFGHLPKFELLHSPDFLPTVSKVIIEEGSRLHMPLKDGDFILSDFDGEISTSVACALALMDASTHPALDDDENVTLKRAASEPWPLSKSVDPDFIHSSSSMTFTEAHLASFDGLNRLDSQVSYGRVYNEVTLGVEKYPKGKYSVVVMFPNEFRSLRSRCCPSELDYIASLSRCKIWDAKGGKSKSVFAKTLDDRLIVKEIKKTEFDSFMKFAPAYFEHMTGSVDSGNQTCLAKILGIYQVTIRNPKSGKETKHDLMVQENLSFGRNITRQYDLKGALHARFTAAADGAGDVLLDQNFVNDMNSSPLYVGQKAKRLLQRAVWNDTTFLKDIGVMDYSLLVGVDRERRELVCGIIDYLRQYTWDKQFETWVKSSLVVPKNVSPTIISPQEYKKRFRKFMDTHFLTVPDHWCSQRSSNPCRLCENKVPDSLIIVKSEKSEDVQAQD
ncbi:putative 1-phosphatidylinositol-3-phosphate 5-kinase FAB1D [Amaranthus tricolor]|uniref:putative 1-phosphatidylinositol-3-phosphate 5-kinase FAB1D n=1 Tax=Amaranthus tricolor TaxID=29722 RepID=UPI0025861CDE|nr:putative 1-phosphatidylinositol-3-phosphate 5-kinase FAB1D [Amaranthus tricolor]